MGLYLSTRRHAAPSHKKTMILSLASLALSLTPALPLEPGDDPELYDPTVFRVFEVEFSQSNWWNILEGYYQAENGQMLETDLTVDGVTYSQVGVAFKGNSSFFGLPNGSEKASFSIKMDYVIPDQELYGVDTMNLNNGFQDPTFMRELIYGNLCDPFVPCPRGAFTKLVINGENWGVYPSIEQIDKKFLRENFESSEGVRWKVPGNTNNPDSNAYPLLYLGSNAGAYMNGYELKTEGAVNPWAHLIETCDVLNNTSIPELEDEIDAVLSVDRAMWVVLVENIFMDDDSYIRKGADYALYWNDHDGRMNLMQRDGNEAFGTGSGPTWPGPSLYNLSPFYHETAANRPVLNRLLAIQDFRQRYLAHYRTLLDEMWKWEIIGPIVEQYRVLIDAEVDAADGQGLGATGAKCIHRGRIYKQAPQIDGVTYVLSKNRLVPGDLVPSRVVDAAGYDLVARPAGELSRVQSLPIFP